MLVLSRKAREQIQIGEEVVVTILQVKGQSVRIGIEAPRNVRVLRSELPKHEADDDSQPREVGAEIPTAMPNTRSSRGAPQITHRGKEVRSTQSPPLGSLLDARRSPRIKSFEIVHSPQRIDLTFPRFDSAAVRSNSFPG
jgi:carbon storage regulator CsrA